MQVWVGGMPAIAAFSTRVAVAAIDAQPAHMMLVVKLHGLRRRLLLPRRVGRAGDDEHHDAGQAVAASERPPSTMLAFAIWFAGLSGRPGPCCPRCAAGFSRLSSCLKVSGC